MALDARTRSSIYGKLVPVLGEDDANRLMSEFPSIEADELVTKQFLRAEMAELRTDLRTEMVELRSELRAEMAELRTELRAEMAELRTDLHAETAERRTDMAELRIEMAERFHQQTVWLGGGLAGATALLLAALPILT